MQLLTDGIWGMVYALMKRNQSLPPAERTFEYGNRNGIIRLTIPRLEIYDIIVEE